MSQGQVESGPVTRVVSNGKAKRQKLELDPLNDLIGQFGLYHFNLSLFIILREAVTALESLVFSLTLPTLEHFQCISGHSDSATSTALLPDNLDSRCYYVSNETFQVKQCQNWTYFEEQYKDTLVVRWDLVCHRQWFGSILHSAYFLGWCLGPFFWGPFADKLGRWGSYALSHVLSLVFGASCLMAPNIYWMLVCRFATAFCTINYCVLNTLQVEMTGTRYRSFITAANHFGWGLGVIMIGFVGGWTNNWKYLAAISPASLLISMPWVLTLPESIRWQVLNGKLDGARKEIKNASKFNLSRENKCTDNKIDMFFAVKKLEGQIDGDRPVKSRLLDLFTDKSLCGNLFSLWGCYLAGSYIYFSRTIDFGPDKESMFVNFLLSGAGEMICLCLATVNMLLFKRKTCVSAFLSLASITYLTEGYFMTYDANLYLTSSLLRYLFDGAAKIFALSANVCLLLMSFEVFPTELRNSGSSLVSTASSFGSMIAPFNQQFEYLFGSRIVYALALSSCIAITSIVLLITAKEMKNTRLVDRVKK